MMNLTDLHNRAMELADLGDISKMKGASDDALRYYNDAFEVERTAANEAKKSAVGEPTESILLRSAASLALCCQRLRESEQLIALALSGEPPVEIAEELRDLLETVNFERHLELKGVALADGEVQLVVAGAGVGYGFAKGEDILTRVDKFMNLATRTMERRLGIPFRKKGPVSVRVKKMSEAYLSTSRAASFAVTLRFGSLPGQTSLPGFTTPSAPYNEIIEDIANSISLINAGRTDELAESFTDKTYLDNFISLTKELAPDGKNVSLFGVTYRKEDTVIPVQLTRTKDEFKNIPIFELESDLKGSDSDLKNETVEGVLSVANGLKGFVKIILPDSKNVVVQVPDGMADIVKTYWEENVSVTYKKIKKAKKIDKVLISIDKPSIKDS